MLKGLKGILEKGLQIALPMIGGSQFGGFGAAGGSLLASLLTGNKPKDALMSAAAGYALTPNQKGGNPLQEMFKRQISPDVLPRPKNSPSSNNNESLLQKIFKTRENQPSFGMQGLAALGPGVLAYMAAKEDAKKSNVPDASEYMSATDKLYGGQFARPTEGRRIQNLMPTYAAQGGIMDIEMSDTVSYPVAGFAQGGFPRKTGSINGPGTKTSDSIPAMLSDGEFVQRTDAVNGAGIMMGAKNAEQARQKGAQFMYALQDKLANMGKNV